MEPRIKKKKILYVITKSNFGGAQRYVYDLLLHIPRKEFEVSVLLGGEGALKNKLEERNIRTLSLPSLQRDVNFFSDISSFFSLIKILKHERPDIVHLNSSKAGFIGGLAARLVGVPKIVFTAHGWAFNENRIIFSKIFFLLLQWKTILFSHATIAVSEKTKKQIVGLPWIRKKIFTIHNGITPVVTKERLESQRELLGSQAEDFSHTTWVGTIAELHTNKGLLFGIKAISKLKDVIYIIIGEGEQKNDLQKHITKHNLEGQVFLVGYKDNASSLLRAFDIFLLPSITEALPYTILEAGSVGLPVVASDVGGIPEIIEDNKTGILVPRRDIQAMRRALSELAKDQSKRKRLGEALKEKVKRDFSLDKMVRETILVYVK